MKSLRKSKRAGVEAFSGGTIVRTATIALFAAATGYPQSRGKLPSIICRRPSLADRERAQPDRHRDRRTDVRLFRRGFQEGLRRHRVRHRNGLSAAAFLTWLFGA